jgi:hypothetical protein
MSIGAMTFLLIVPQAGAGTPSRATAARYAHRTFIVQRLLGKRRFKLNGPRSTVGVADGSTLSAFPIVLSDSGDGTGQDVLLFHNRRFVGWASRTDMLKLSVSRAGDAIAVDYGDFQGSDSFCCPSAIKTVNYRWQMGRVVADGTPPTVYGRRLERLHLAKH